MLLNTNTVSFSDDDANYDENDAVWEEEEKDELTELGFKDVEEEVEEDEVKEKVVVAEDEDEDDEDEDEDEEEIEGFGLEKDV